MVEKILQFFSLACRHNKTTQPFTASESAPATKGSDWDPVRTAPSHYVVCLDCGRKFAYDWSNMRMVR
jgi:hypothetical protein